MGGGLLGGARGGGGLLGAGGGSRGGMPGGMMSGAGGGGAGSSTRTLGTSSNSVPQRVHLAAKSGLISRDCRNTSFLTDSTASRDGHEPSWKAMNWETLYGSGSGVGSAWLVWRYCRR